MIKDVGSKEGDTKGTNITQSALALQTDGAMSEELEDGELEEEAENGEVVTNSDSIQKRYVCGKPVKLSRSRLMYN